MTSYFSEIEKFKRLPKHESMRSRFKSTNPDYNSYWDFKDKRCKYHRRDYNTGWQLAERYLEYAERYRQAKYQIIDKFQKKYPKTKSSGLFFFRLGFFDCIKEVKSKNHWKYVFADITDTVFNKDKYQLYQFIDDPVDDYISDEDYWIKHNYRNIVYLLLKPYRGFHIEVTSSDCQTIRFIKDNIKGYLSCNINSGIYGLIVMDTVKDFDKAQRCQVKLTIPDYWSKECDTELLDLIYWKIKELKKK